MKVLPSVLLAACTVVLSGCAVGTQASTTPEIPVQQQEYVRVCGDPSQEVSVDEAQCEEGASEGKVAAEWFYPHLQRPDMNSYPDGTSLAGALRAAPPGSLVHSRNDVEAMIEGKISSGATTPLKKIASPAPVS